MSDASDVVQTEDQPSTTQLSPGASRIDIPRPPNLEPSAKNRRGNRGNAPILARPDDAVELCVKTDVRNDLPQRYRWRPEARPAGKHIRFTFFEGSSVRHNG